MPGHTLGFGIIGAGMIAEYHKKAIEANSDLGAKLIAIGHYDPSKFPQISAKFGVPCISVQNLLAHPDVDVVTICTPSGQHASQALDAIKAGKHVLVEKPMALNLEDADSMIDLARSQGVKLGVVLQRRMDPTFQAVKQAIDAGDLGRLTLGLVKIPYFRPQTYYDQAAWRGTWALDGGGVIMNQGIHLVDLLVWYMGDPQQVSAYADTLSSDIEVEDTLVGIIRFSNGAMATITATTTTSPGFPHTVEIYGTHGGIQLEGEGIRRWELAEPSKAQVKAPGVAENASAGAAADPRGISTENHTRLFRDFILAIQENRDPSIDGSEGRRSLALTLELYKSAGLLQKQH